MSLGQGALESLALGQLGCKIIDGVASITPDTPYTIFGIIQVIADAQFTSLTSAKDPTGADVMKGTWTGKTFLAGTIIYGAVTELQLASGVVIAYNA